MSLRRGFRLSEWTVYPLEGRFQQDDQNRRVQPKSMDVLLCLAEADGEVVEREELLRRIWGERAVTDEPLTRCIGELRRALGDSRKDPEFILTVPKRGYRLLLTPVPLQEPAVEAAGREHPQLTAQQQAKRRKGLTVLAAIVALVAVISLVQIGMPRVGSQAPTKETPAALPASADNRSIAVLPFADLSPHEDQTHMSDGVAEQILSLLMKVDDLRVISRSSSFSLKGQAVDIPTVVERFGVSHVLEGSVRTAGGRIRINAQLIDARNDTQVWSETYDSELTDVFAIQDEIALAVVDKLQLTLRPGIAVSRETNPKAYEYFLRARYLHEQPAGDAFQRAFELYQAALEVDDRYVPAWVWLAALYDDTINSTDLPREEVLERMFDAIGRALEIDSEDPLALGMSSVLLAAWTDELERATAQMQRALDLDPGNPILLRWAVIALNGLGKHKEAVDVAEYLFARDPVGNISRVNLASTYILAGQFEDAVRICEIHVASIEENGPCRSRLIVAYLYTGNPDGAKDQLERAAGTRTYLRLAPMVFYSLGAQDSYNTALSDLRERYTNGDASMAYWLARTYAFTNEIDQAFEWLYRARADGVLSLTATSSYFVHLHGDPRWRELLRELDKLPEKTEQLHLSVRLPG